MPEAHFLLLARRALRRAALVGAGLLAAATVTAPVLAAAPAAAEPLWLRYPAISPDGREIAFAFQGQLWVVPSGGGTARLLVAHGAHASQPVWSPDGRQIAFASDMHGNADVFLVPAAGGPSQRLTTHSASERPIGFTPDGRHVLFTAQRMDSRSNLLFPSGAAGELYQVAVEPGRRPQQLLTTPVSAGQFDRSGTRLVYEDWKGYEDPWRKHHVSPVARDLWLYDARAGTHRRLTAFGGEDRNPVWAPDQQSLYYLSEQGGSFNVWKLALAKPEAPEQVTRLARHPVRFLSAANDGTLAFGHDGQIYVLPAGAVQPRKVAVQIATDTRNQRLEAATLTRGASEFAVSPDGAELAFVLRGDVYVASTEFGDTRRITSTPEQERSVSFSPDGRRLLFAGEREGSWNLYEASLPGTKKEQPYFFSAAQVPVKTLLKNGKENFQPRYSPDGKEVAYLENRVALKVLNLASGASRVVMPAEMSYSYNDGDQWFDWSPDGRWLLANFIDRQRWSFEVGLFDAQGKAAPVNLTKSGYEDVHPLWAAGGRMVAWATDRMGLRATGGLAQQDVYAMFLTREGFDRFRLDKAEFAQLQKQEDEERKAAEEKKAADRKGKPAEEAPAAAEPLKIELEGLEDRLVRLTPASGLLRSFAVAPDGESLYVLLQAGETVEMHLVKPRAGESRRVAVLPAGKPQANGDADLVDLVIDAKGEAAYWLNDGSVMRVRLPKGGEGEFKPEPLKFSAEQRLDRAAERAHLFEHVWRQTRDKLYVADLGGVDWAGLKRDYERFLPWITHNADFAEMLSEMLGELNVSHTGSGYRARTPGGDATAALGLFFDEAHAGAGLKVAEVIAGGPLDTARSALRAGMVIEKIDGSAIAAGAEFDSLLNGKAGKRIEIAVLDPASGRRFTEVVRPIALGAQSELLYRRWVKRQRALVDQLSGGRLGYVHVRGMDDGSFREVVSEVLGRASAKEALIVDTRFNGGGNLHDDLATLLSGKRYLEFLPRGQSLGWEPGARWTKPSAVLISESNYSDAHLFPWLYQHQRLGKLVGMPVAGTGTAVWWETLMDPTLYFGIPQVGFRDERGRFMETTPVEPEVRVPLDPAKIAAGEDEQTAAAVRELLRR